MDELTTPATESINTEKQLKVSAVQEKVKRTELSELAPNSNELVWGITVLLWPISGAIFAYMSLKRLWKQDTAHYPIVASIIITIVISYILMYPLANVEIQWFVLQIPMAFMIVWFQYKWVKEWAEKNPTLKYRNSLKDIFPALAWVVLYFIIAFIIALIIW